MNLEEIKEVLTQRIREVREWLLLTPSGASFALNSDEIELTAEREKVLFSFQSAQGFQTWRLIDYKFEKQKILCEISRNFGAEKTKIELIPRLSAGEFSAAVELGPDRQGKQDRKTTDRHFSKYQAHPRFPARRTRTAGANHF